MEPRPVAGAVTQTDEHGAGLQRGISLHKAGQLEAASRVLLGVMVDRTLSLGPRHPLTVSVKCELGLVYRRMGARTEALSLQRDVLEIRRQDLGSDAWLTQQSMCMLADTLDGMGVKTHGGFATTPGRRRRGALGTVEALLTLSMQKHAMD
jgi:hypothetical protein